MPIFPKPPGVAPVGASTVDEVLAWFDAVEKLELKPTVSQAIINRLVQDKVVAKGAYKVLDMPTENQLIDEIGAAGIDISGLDTDEGNKTNPRGWWRKSGSIMLDRLSERLSSVAAPDASSQSKDVAAGRALNPGDTAWVGGSSELANFTTALAADELDTAMAMLGDPPPPSPGGLGWSDNQKRFATIMKRASIGFTGSSLTEKDASPAELRVNAAFQKLRALQGKEIINLVKQKWRHRVGIMPAFASNLIKVLLKFTDDSSSSSSESLNQAWCDALVILLDTSMTSLRAAEEKSLSKAVSVLFGAMRLCLPHLGSDASSNAVAIIDLWADVDNAFVKYPYPKTGTTSGCFDLIQRFIFPVLNEWIATYWSALIAGQPITKTLAAVLEMDVLQQSVKTGVGILAQYASTVRSGLAVAKIAGNPLPTQGTDGNTDGPAQQGPPKRTRSVRHPHLTCAGCNRKGHELKTCHFAKGNEHLRRGTPEFKAAVLQRKVAREAQNQAARGFSQQSTPQPGAQQFPSQQQGPYQSQQMMSPVFSTASPPFVPVQSRQQQPINPSPPPGVAAPQGGPAGGQPPATPQHFQNQRKCYTCGIAGHERRSCPMNRQP